MIEKAEEQQEISGDPLGQRTTASQGLRHPSFG